MGDLWVDSTTAAEQKWMAESTFFFYNVPQENHGTTQFKVFIKIHTRQIQFAVSKPTC